MRSTMHGVSLGAQKLILPSNAISISPASPKSNVVL